MKQQQPIDIQTLADNIIGSDAAFTGPFGKRPILYADTTASGKSLKFIETYIQQEILSTYANTHTEASWTGRQTGLYREEARSMIREAIGAPEQDYAVLFCGSGSTAAIAKFAQVLGLAPCSPAIEDDLKRPVVFIGPFEHHSNELIWREGPADVVVIPVCPQTEMMDTNELKRQLKLYQDRPLKIGSFSAASNVTGIRSDTKFLTSLLHEYGALACFDFAAAGSHTQVDLSRDGIDVGYFSPHKYLGGPQTPGLLIARRSIFQNEVPTVPGGGTVEYVQPHGHLYTDDIEHREEGGTPSIVESIRAGLVYQLHHHMGARIADKEERYLSKALKSWFWNSKIEVLAPSVVAKDRVSIVSFLVRSKSRPEMYLHHNFVVVLLNDLFGIQARGGCACAAPYSHHLLNIDRERSDAIMKDIKEYGGTVKPGWARLAFGYYFSPGVVNYIIDAVHWVANHGELLLPLYKFNPHTTMFVHRDQEKHGVDSPSLLWNFNTLGVKYAWKKQKGSYPSPHYLKKLLREADITLEKAKRQLYKLNDLEFPPKMALPSSTDSLRWFVLPHEVSIKASGVVRNSKKEARRLDMTTKMSTMSSLQDEQVYETKNPKVVRHTLGVWRKWKVTTENFSTIQA